MGVPRAQAHPVLQREEQPQYSKRPHEGDRVQEGGNSAVFDRWNKVQWSSPFNVAFGAFDAIRSYLEE